jgi:hypothetical protein
MKTMTTYTDRNGRWWCRAESRGYRVWASDMECEMEAVYAARGCLVEAYGIEPAGDFVMLFSGKLVRREPGASPQAMCERASAE